MEVRVRVITIIREGRNMTFYRVSSCRWFDIHWPWDLTMKQRNPKGPWLKYEKTNLRLKSILSIQVQLKKAETSIFTRKICTWISWPLATFSKWINIVNELDNLNMYYILAQSQFLTLQKSHTFIFRCRIHWNHLSHLWSIKVETSVFHKKYTKSTNYILWQTYITSVTWNLVFHASHSTRTTLIYGKSRQ